MSGRQGLRIVIAEDLYRYKGKTDIMSFLKAYLLIPGFRIVFWYRIASRIKGVFGIIPNLILIHYNYLFGIGLHRNTNIGRGFYIGHFSGITISSKAKIGNNVNISQCVTIGVAGRGEQRGVPVIGDNVYIAASAVVIGKIKVGNNVVIGANAVVTKDVPDNTIVAGVPAKVISMIDGDNEYIENRV